MNGYAIDLSVGVTELQQKIMRGFQRLSPSPLERVDDTTLGYATRANGVIPPVSFFWDYEQGRVVIIGTGCDESKGPEAVDAAFNSITTDPRYNYLTWADIPSGGRRLYTTIDTNLDCASQLQTFEEACRTLLQRFV